MEEQQCLKDGGYWPVFLSLVLLCSLAVPLAAAARLCSYQDADCELLASLDLEGYLEFNNLDDACKDFGGMQTNRPKAVLYPSSVYDISTLVKAIYHMGSGSNLTVAAKGHAHSIHGQAQAKGGVVIEMSSLRGIELHKGYDDSTSDHNYSYVDVRGGELWIDVLQATLQHGLAPMSWTDYLYLSVGGTLSNAGVSGQAFLHGPQISNVYELEVVTGKGDVVVCSRQHNSDLFYATLGGLGQFGIITKARVALERAPRRVKWIRALYSDAEIFMRDQEYLISQPRGQTFDYVEGFVVANTGTSLLDNWRSSLFKPRSSLSSSELSKKMKMSGDILYYLEVALNYDDSTEASGAVDERVAALLSSLRYIPMSEYSNDISYMEFLNRVHTGEVKLRAKGLWDIPHPWLNLLVPRSKMAEFDAGVFKGLLQQLASCKGGQGGPIIVYPMNRNKWDDRMSAAIPEEEEVFYLVALLRSPTTASDEAEAAGSGSVRFSMQELVQQNEEVLSFCERLAGLGGEIKQYLPRLSGASQWERQFGPRKWALFLDRKAAYDPSALLSPGQNIIAPRSTLLYSSKPASHLDHLQNHPLISHNPPHQYHHHLNHHPNSILMLATSDQQQLAQS